MVAIVKSGSPRFRLFTAADIDPIIAIENSVYDYPWSRGIFLDCMRVGYECVALEMQQQLVAYSILSIASAEAHLLNLAVAREHHRQGYGRILLEHMLDRARRLNAKTVFLEVRASNRAASSLYESVCFNEIGVRRNYYPGQEGREDGIIYAIQL